MKLNPHINFGGRCEDAFRFYELQLGGKIVTMLKWGESAMAKEVPPEWHQEISHATLILGESELAGVDDPFEAYERPRGFQLLLETDGAEEAERFFRALAEKGTVKLPMQKTFWASRFGTVVDQFNVPWEINCTKAP